MLICDLLRKYMHTWNCNYIFGWENWDLIAVQINSKNLKGVYLIHKRTFYTLLMNFQNWLKMDIVLCSPINSFFFSNSFCLFRYLSFHLLIYLSIYPSTIHSYIYSYINWFINLFLHIFFIFIYVTYIYLSIIISFSNPSFYY